jgi:hypothetical protein
LVTVIPVAPGTSTDGAVAVIAVDDTTPKLAAGVEPKRTAVVPPRLTPVMVTVVPPDTGLDEGVMELMAGSGIEYVVATPVLTPAV